MSSDNNTAQVAEWIRSDTNAVAFSTHTALGPIPQIEGVRIITVMLLRDPIDRIRSAYRFERKQNADTWGAELAKQHDLEGYVRARLERPKDRQCRNFQTHRLATLVPGGGSELDRARKGLNRLSVVGLVEAFDDAVAALTEQIRPTHPDFTWNSVRANRTAPAPMAAEDIRIDSVLHEANRDDEVILTEARALLNIHQGTG